MERCEILEVDRLFGGNKISFITFAERAECRDEKGTQD